MPGISEVERMSVYTSIAAILHLGNISFEDDPDDNRGGCRVTDQSEASLQTTAMLMGLDPDELRRALTARVMQATKGGYKGTVIMVPLKVINNKISTPCIPKLFDRFMRPAVQEMPWPKLSTPTCLTTSSIGSIRASLSR